MASIIGSKFKCLRDNKIMGRVAFKLIIHLPIKLSSAVKCYILKEVCGRGKGMREVDSGGQVWGELVGVAFLSVNCDPHGPQGQTTEDLSSLQTFQRHPVQWEDGYLKLLLYEGKSTQTNGRDHKEQHTDTLGSRV